MSISPLAVVSKDAEIGAGVRIDPFAIIHDSVILEPEVFIGAHCEIGVPSALATSDVAPDTLVAGVPARSRGTASKIKLRDGSNRGAYPWCMHFDRGYPPELIAEWRNQVGSN